MNLVNKRMDLEGKYKKKASLDAGELKKLEVDIAAYTENINEKERNIYNVVDGELKEAKKLLKSSPKDTKKQEAVRNLEKKLNEWKKKLDNHKPKKQPEAVEKKIVAEPQAVPKAVPNKTTDTNAGNLRRR
jgi:hypothetical protein